MLFSSPVFIFGFLSVLLVLYFPIKRFRLLSNILLFVASILFYAYGEPKFVLLLLLSIIMNWIFGLLVDKYREKKTAARLIITAMLFYNLLQIFIFKYLRFTLANINAATGGDFTIPNIVLPIGISFFTFQAISYVIDVYRGNGEVQKNILNVGLYLAFFPQLIAGPIVRYQTVANEINYREETFDDFSTGVCRFISGLAKKVLLSNQLAIIADAAYGASSPSVAYAWLGALAYALQIYYDFSGYSDMAIGLGRMFGFHFDENFNYPYVSKSITEFWRRWHISLGTWFRDYVYIPLGGSRVSTFSRQVFNLFSIWLLTGIWHGASWNFIVWGLYFFVFIFAERYIFKKIPAAIGHVYAMAVVFFSWVLFRAESLGAALLYLKSMFGATQNALFDDMFFMYLSEKWIFIIAALIFAIPTAPFFEKKLAKSKLAGAFYPVVMISLFLLCVAYLLKNTYNPFIYFNF